MSSPVEMLARLRVDVTSPGGSVRARYSHRDGFRLAFVPGLAKRHDDRALDTEVSATLMGILRGYREAMDRVSKEVDLLAGRDPGWGGADRQRHLRTVAERCADIETSATSPGGCARVRFVGTERVECRLRPGAAPRSDMDWDGLAREVVSAYNEAKWNHAQQTAKTNGARFLG